MYGFVNGIGCTIALGAAGAFSAAPAPSQSIETILQDDAALLYRSPGQVSRSLDRMATLGVDRVRITASWRRLEPRPGAYDADALHRLDRAVDGARRRGMRVMIDLGFFAPRWAVTRPATTGERNVWRPSVPAFGRFSERMARRYRGRVRLWTTWNEPNNWTFLQPQSEGGHSVSPGLYRRLHVAAYDRVKRVSPRNRVLIGGLASRGSSSTGPLRGIPPLRFTRELACVDEQLLAVRTGACRDFRPLRADGFAMHPYSRRTTPGANDPAKDRVQLGELYKLTTLLRQLREGGRLAKPLSLYITEYGYETDPPDPTGVDPATEARFAGDALLLAWRTPEVRSFPQFLLQDLTPLSNHQSGLFTAGGRPKPESIRSFTLPFIARAVRGAGGAEAVIAFGQVRPGHAAQPLLLERRAARGGPWRQVACLASDGQGVYRHVLPYAGPGSYRAVWAGPSGPRASAAMPVGEPDPILGTPEGALQRLF